MRDDFYKKLTISARDQISSSFDAHELVRRAFINPPWLHSIRNAAWLYSRIGDARHLLGRPLLEATEALRNMGAFSRLATDLAMIRPTIASAALLGMNDVGRQHQQMLNLAAPSMLAISHAVQEYSYQLPGSF